MCVHLFVHFISTQKSTHHTPLLLLDWMFGCIWYIREERRRCLLQVCHSNTDDGTDRGEGADGRGAAAVAAEKGVGGGIR